MKPYIGIPDPRIDRVAALLSDIVADEMSLYVKTIKFHWDVACENFTGYYELFESQYRQLEVAIEEISERICGMGSLPGSTVDEYLEKSPLYESRVKSPSHRGMIKELLDGHRMVIQGLKRSIDECCTKYNDTRTADFLIKLKDDHETSAWTLRRYLK